MKLLQLNVSWRLKCKYQQNNQDQQHLQNFQQKAVRDSKLYQTQQSTNAIYNKHKPSTNAKQTFPAMKSIPVSLSYSGIKVLDKYIHAVNILLRNVCSTTIYFYCTEKHYDYHVKKHNVNKYFKTTRYLLI